MQSFSVGQKVYVRNFSGHPPVWFPGVVSGTPAPLTYLVETPDGGIVRRHVDHIRSRSTEPAEARDHQEATSVGAGRAPSIVTAPGTLGQADSSSNSPSASADPALLSATPGQSEPAAATAAPLTSGESTDVLPRADIPEGRQEQLILRRSARPHKAPDRYGTGKLFVPRGKECGKVTYG